MKTIEAIKGIGDNIEEGVTKNRIVFKYQGSNFATLLSRREFFYIEWKEEEGWNIADASDLQSALRVIDEHVKAAYELVKGRQATS